ncbi:hypothetical protein [Bergeriella denitrificans]|uniref:hypothetical protein n=1 Tax=Bergeriella denitrificans TaxID=494 RepID=UPI0015588462
MRDAFGVGATGQSTAFPFTVDTVRNRVGVDGDLVVNGKAIINRFERGGYCGR